MDAAPPLHPSEQDLSSYGLGKLDDRSAEAVAGHLERCADCRRRVAEMSADSFLGRVRDARPEPGDKPELSQPAWTRSFAGPNSAPPPRADTLPPGLADHPDYEIKRELGRGGMGVVYLAHNRLLGRDEVLKVMSRHLVEKPGVLDRFLREIRAVARLRHPNIVAAYSATRLDQSIAFAMEYVEGLDLSRLVKAKGPLPVAHACLFAHQAALGLQHAHEEGLVHRDIKPGNLMLSRRGDKATVKVLDFGLAKATREQGIDGGLTSEGQALGTPDYIAPEQILDAPNADIRADIYSLGGTLYHLLTGRPPFQAKTLYDIYQAHISRDADPLNLVRPEVPSELAALVAKMMAKDPGRRFQTPKEVAEALNPFFKKGVVTVAQDAKPARDGRGIAEPKRVRTSPPMDPAVAPKHIKVLPSTISESAGTDLQWQGLIDLASPISGSSPGKAVGKTSDRGRHFGPLKPWPALAIGFLLFGMAWAGVFKVMTRDGVIVLEGLPHDADVFVDGSRVRVDWPSGGSAEITIPPGQRGVEVRLDGYLAFGQKVSIEPGGKGRLTVSLISSSLSKAEQSDEPAGVKPKEVAEGRSDTNLESPKLPMQLASIFSGGDLTNWVKGSAFADNWKVEDGILQSFNNGPLYYIHKEYDDFYLRAELKADVNYRGNIWLRSAVDQDTNNWYSVIINTLKERLEPETSGSIVRSTRESQKFSAAQLCDAGEEAIKPDEWFVLEVVAIGNHAVTKINGIAKCYVTDSNPYKLKGCIAMHRSWRSKGGQLYCRRMEVAELDGSPAHREGSLKAALGLPFKAAESAPANPPVRLDFPAMIRAGKWMHKDGELVETQRTSKPGALLLFGDPSWSNYDLKFEAMSTSGSHGFKAIFHCNPNNNGNRYAFAYGNYGNNWHDLSYQLDGKWARDPDVLKRGSIEFNRWYKVKVEVRGSESRCYVDGERVFQHQNDRFKSGLVGFETWDATARFRAIEVASPDGKVLFKGLPDLAAE